MKVIRLYSFTSTSPWHFQSHNSSHNTTRMTTNPHFDIVSSSRILHDLNAIHHVKGHVTDLQSMRRCLVGTSTDDQISVSDRLHFVTGVLVDQEVEQSVEIVEENHHLDWFESGADGGEANDVGE